MAPFVPHREAGVGTPSEINIGPAGKKLPIREIGAARYPRFREVCVEFFPVATKLHVFGGRLVASSGDAHPPCPSLHAARSGWKAIDR